MSPVSGYVSYGARWMLLVLVFPAMAVEAPKVMTEMAREMEILRQVTLSGTVTSARVSRLSAEVSGQVDSLQVDFGDRVEAGEILLKLDSEMGKWEYNASQALTEQMHAELNDARRRYEDAQRLRKQNSISENEIQLRQAELQIKASALKRQQAEEKKQQARFERYVLRAPFDGVISDKMTEVGEWIEPGTPVLELVALDILHADFAVPQQFYRLINKNSRITLTLDALAQQQFEGRIHRVVPVNNPDVRTFMLRVQFVQPDAHITPGMSVDGLLQLSTRERGVVVSRDAVLRYPDGRVTVWVVNQESGRFNVTERIVTTGHGFDGLVEIREGINAGDRLVVEGNEALQTSQEVRIEPRDGEH